MSNLIYECGCEIQELNVVMSDRNQEPNSHHVLRNYPARGPPPPPGQQNELLQYLLQTPRGATGRQDNTIQLHFESTPGQSDQHVEVEELPRREPGASIMQVNQNAGVLTHSGHAPDNVQPIRTLIHRQQVHVQGQVVEGQVHQTQFHDLISINPPRNQQQPSSRQSKSSTPRSGGHEGGQGSGGQASSSSRHHHHHHHHHSNGGQNTRDSGGDSKGPSSQQQQQHQQARSAMVQLASAVHKVNSWTKHVGDMTQFWDAIMEVRDSNRELQSTMSAIRKGNENWTVENQLLQGQLDTMKHNVETLEFHLTLKNDEVQEKCNRVIELNQILENTRIENGATKDELEQSKETLNKLLVKQVEQARALRTLKSVKDQLQRRNKNLRGMNKKCLKELQTEQRKKKGMECQVKAYKSILRNKERRIHSLKRELSAIKTEARKGNEETERLKLDNINLKRKVDELSKNLQGEQEWKREVKKLISSKIKNSLEKCSGDIEVVLEEVMKDKNDPNFMEEGNPAEASVSYETTTIKQNDGPEDEHESEMGQIFGFLDQTKERNEGLKRETIAVNPPPKAKSPPCSSSIAVIRLPRLDLLQAARAAAGNLGVIRNKSRSREQNVEPQPESSRLKLSLNYEK